MADILIVEDEPGINELMRRTLEMVGHRSFQAFTGLEALKLIERHTVDLVLLDINLPDGSGFGLIRQFEKLPVIYVTARGEVQDKVKGLYSGAQDYIVKPFDVEELLARVQVVLRRFHKETVVYRVGDVEINIQTRTVTAAGEKEELTSREFELLKALVQNQNIALSRERLLEMAWGMDYEGEERTVDVHIQRLRKKLHLEDMIRTVFKYGYRLEI
ncbi:response regulator transcription factor [Ruminococcus sp. OA3]|uniref:response regulator transcription factor n=1 Tax=Ruminococcus sp. OA3 TaxID=2914164 RepID=UPI001F05D860|nr:response regulator transcription factor [Ruminococcus sp. OA3]MCH1981023.1 response regulator transcription factor [Ruminococcus sp. OA3]